MMKEQPGNEKWRQLKVGDKVRVVSWPRELSRTRMHTETVELYELLIASQILLTVSDIDESGIPTGTTAIADEKGDRTEYLLLNHSGIQVVQ